MLKEYALFSGEKEAYCCIDATEGEYIPDPAAAAGGNGESAGVFYLGLSSPRSNSWAYYGGRSAFFKKKAES